MPNKDRRRKMHEKELNEASKRCKTVTSYFRINNEGSSSQKDISDDNTNCTHSGNEGLSSQEKDISSTSTCSNEPIEENDKSSSAQKVYDIHEILKEGLSTLTDHQKYLILRNHFKPTEQYIFKKTLKHGCNRSCKKEHLSNCFVYSPTADGVFCIYCALFLNADKRKSLGAFVNKGYTDWHNIKEKESRHSGNTYHKVAVQEGHGIIERFENASSTIPSLTNDIFKERNAEYPQIVEALGRVIHLLGKQGLALRGHREGSSAESDDKNQGNFLALVHEIAHYHPLLKKHLEDPQRKDMKYLGPKSQNELINIIGIQMIQKRLVEEIIESGMHSISADEVTSSNDEILSICIRYVNNDREICEPFLQFVDLERITGECIGKALLKFYEDVGVNVKECKGQCYDGASNMQSQKKGAASYISKASPSAIVTHCCSHNLNLTLAASCKFPIIENVMETYKAVTLFFNLSPKREGLLEHIIQKRCLGAKKRKVLIGLCKTRWSERDISYEHFYLAIPFMVEAFEIICGTHPGIDNFDRTFTEGWEPKTKKDADSHLHAVTKFQFIIALVSLYRFLHPLAGITKRLQGRSIDVVKAYNEVQSCIDDLKHTRECIDKEFNVIYQQSKRLAEILSVEPSIPRTAARQMHRNNVPAENPEEYYRRVIAVPLIENFISEMTFRFNKFNTTASKLLLLVPSIICNPDYEDSLSTTDDLKKQYSNDLQNSDILDQEISLWKRRWQAVKVEDRPDSLAKAIKECDDLRFPNVFILLKIGCTLPVTSAECERSFSVMRRMRTWLRSSMTSNRLTSLAIMNIHRTVEVDYKDAAKLFFELYPRKIHLANLVFD